jgi:hypothetical protein
MVADFQRRVASIPQDLCAPFHTQAQYLETQLLTVYQMVAKMARRIEDLQQVSGLWGCVVNMCDKSLIQLKGLAEAHPYCGANIYYDKVLDLRNKCHRLQEMHS